MRQFYAKSAFENGGDDAVEKRQNRSHNPDRHDDADNQKDANADDRDGIPVCHRGTMQAFARGC
jgi:hypothetical protein